MPTGCVLQTGHMVLSGTQELRFRRGSQGSHGHVTREISSPTRAAPTTVQGGPMPH